MPRGVLCCFISTTPQLLAVTAPVSHQYLHPCHGVLVTEGHLLCVGPHADGFCVCSHVIPTMDVGPAGIPTHRSGTGRFKCLSNNARVTFLRLAGVTYMSVIS